MMCASSKPLWVWYGFWGGAHAKKKKMLSASHQNPEGGTF